MPAMSTPLDLPKSKYWIGPCGSGSGGQAYIFITERCRFTKVIIRRVTYKFD